MGLALAGCDRQNASAPQGNDTATANAAEPQGQRYPTGRLDRSHAGMPAPTINFEDPEGRPTTMAAFRGRPVLVNLWATWCGPCVVEMPALDALAAREGENLQVVAISQDMDGRRKVTDFFAARRFSALQPYLDSRLDFMMGLRVDTLPTTILYDAEGREVWRMTGMAEWGDTRTTRLLDEAEAG
ncbi:TlpA disulfide reductase family protein [Sphingosinicella sp. LHD-64]|uniref:TlpA family protein disulfide reductase n=1 Tax=Sphingosinicella sp. LHD-64 TaxID=3072139 RepID=UPI00280F4121|nr:TlpA disulfide reductase family protein [Sphingosinicella sp. LHD-64]MDQ8755843.1 TlpA disulfide reductase family protein [Sphingosinicella sp. LHD-64]